MNSEVRINNVQHILRRISIGHRSRESCERTAWRNCPNRSAMNWPGYYAKRIRLDVRAVHTGRFEWPVSGAQKIGVKIWKFDD